MAQRPIRQTSLIYVTRSGHQIPYTSFEQYRDIRDRDAAGEFDALPPTPLRDSNDSGMDIEERATQGQAEIAFNLKGIFTGSSSKSYKTDDLQAVARLAVFYVQNYCLTEEQKQMRRPPKPRSIPETMHDLATMIIERKLLSPPPKETMAAGRENSTFYQLEALSAQDYKTCQQGLSSLICRVVDQLAKKNTDNGPSAAKCLPRKSNSIVEINEAHDLLHRFHQMLLYEYYKDLAGISKRPAGKMQQEVIEALYGMLQQEGAKYGMHNHEELLLLKSWFCPQS